uniref:CSON001366 protein n=1 Tax=Culicoides sonorensis TaxID=179676 RepID=A0A336MGE7_CULSO
MNCMEKIKTYLSEKYNRNEDFQKLWNLIGNDFNERLNNRKRRAQNVNSIEKLFDVLVRLNQVEFIRNIVIIIQKENSDIILAQLLNAWDEEILKKLNEISISEDNEYKKQRNRPPPIKLEIIDENPRTVFNNSDFNEITDTQKFARLNLQAHLMCFQKRRN